MKKELFEELTNEKLRTKNEIITELCTTQAHINATNATEHNHKPTPQQGANNTAMHGYATMHQFNDIWDADYDVYDRMTTKTTQDAPDPRVSGVDTTRPFNTTMAPENPAPILKN